MARRFISSIGAIVFFTVACRDSAVTPGLEDAGAAGDADSLEDGAASAGDAASVDAAAAQRDGAVADAADASNGPKLFVAVGYAGRRIVSSDGVIWQNDIVESGPGGDDNQQLRGIGYGASGFVAVGGASAGRILVSDDAMTWSEVGDQSNFLGDVAFGNGLYIAVGSSGRFVRSTDGHTWTNPGIDRGSHLRTITFGAGRFVAAGDSGRRITTEDGLTWTDDVAGGGTLRAVVFAIGKFIAVGDGGRRIVSADGRTWTNEVTGGPLLRGVAYGNQRVVQSAAIARSRRPTAWLGKNTRSRAPTYLGLLLGMVCSSRSGKRVIATRRPTESRSRGARRTTACRSSTSYSRTELEESDLQGEASFPTATAPFVGR